MPVIHVNVLRGRSAEVLRTLAAGLTQATVEALGVRPEQVRVLVHEVEPQHWFVGGEALGAPTPESNQNG
jgi:4-oxalocrotonate tautomerase